MSSIVAMLLSVLISCLHFTWVNSSGHSLEPLEKIIYLASNYGYITIGGPRRAVPEIYHLCAGAARRQHFRPICD